MQKGSRAKEPGVILLYCIVLYCIVLMSVLQCKEEVGKVTFHSR